MKVLLRVDASPDMGGGHARRCRALADGLASLGAECRFAVRDLGLDYAALGIAAEQIIFVSDVTDQASDSSVTVQAAEAHNFAPDLVIVDHYGLSVEWYDAVRAGTGARIAAIDDLADRPISADWLIDHNWHTSHVDKYAAVLRRDDTVLLTGPRHALLDPNFADAPLAPVADKVTSIGVFMGASDAAGATAKVLEAIALSGFEGAVEVVATSANPHLATLRTMIDARPNWILSVDLPDLATFMAQHGLQIGAGGGATWERCAAAAPTIAAITADNQRASLPALAEKDVLHLHGASPIDPVIMADEISALLGDASRRAHYADASRKLVDGRGALRVAAALTPLHLRPALTDDAQQAYAWRNAPETRALSTDPSEIEWASHKHWWAAAVADPDRNLLVVSLGSREVGILRFDVANDGAAIVSIYFDPAATGLGFGTRALEAGRRWLIENEPRAKRLLAQIDDRNAPSQAIFKRAGFAPIGSLLYERPLKNQSGAIA